eukprot:CAMPEP_0175952150 /NCGR_PEP_ID=MMETSP0108-20121206/30588_1 /TAXON_ID=195067 ORGANISM="Goniomonas pacifica, Strain CCMP1869" /NCGR_SAMPLE_ID=MMETSP0108 /ASSEMBLY_ACC=CAM_ASM_000204 /LENGTH=84 /DNA_ID=CAMNT_0017278473 /DNA_START=10 /DNA_END=264 /DNA_ORIENTATION=-
MAELPILSDLIVSGGDNTVRLWRASTGDVRIMVGHSGVVTSVCMSPRRHRPHNLNPLLKSSLDSQHRIVFLYSATPSTCCLIHT